MHCVDRLAGFLVTDSVGQPVPGQTAKHITTTSAGHNLQHHLRHHKFDSSENLSGLSGYSSSVGSNNSYLEDTVENGLVANTITITAAPATTNAVSDGVMDSLPVLVIHEGKEVEMLAEENLAATDLCHLLVLKLSLERTASWALLLRLRSAGLERPLEDDEEVVGLCRKYAAADPVLEMKRCSGSRWAFFDNPSRHFQLDMIETTDSSNDSTSADNKEKLHNLTHQLHYAERFQATVCGPVKVSEGNLTVSNSKVQRPAKSAMAQLSANILTLAPVDANCSKVTLDMASTEEFFSTTAEAELTVTLVDLRVGQVQQMTCATVAQKITWLTCLRIARCDLKNLRRQAQQFLRQRPVQELEVCSSQYLEMEGKAYLDYGSSHRDKEPMSADDGCHEMSTPRSSSRTAEDLRSGHRRSNIRSRTYSSSSGGSPSSSTAGSPTKVYHGQHHPAATSLSHPWFYEDLGRDEATRILEKYATVNGVFLVRNSSRAPGSHVLSFVHNAKISHMMIQRIDADCLTLDCGRTKFYDLQQLIEFYQLNLGLPVKLTHFVVHHG